MAYSIKYLLHCTAVLQLYFRDKNAVLMGDTVLVEITTPFPVQTVVISEIRWRQ